MKPAYPDNTERKPMKPEDDNHALELTWQLRVSRRARYAKLQIKPFGGLEVVIPPRFPRSEIAGLVEIIFE